MKKTKMNDTTRFWDLYEAGRRVQSLRYLRQNTQAAYNFYEGDQWKGLPVQHPERLPMLNFIKPSINYKLNMICLNTMRVNISGEPKRVCAYLTETINKKMDDLRIDNAHWTMVREGLITGNGYLYFPDGSIMETDWRGGRRDVVMQFIDTNNIFFGDEKERDIQKQPYILICERRRVKEIREKAAENGVPEEEIRQIVPDEDYVDEEVSTDTREEVENHDRRCTSLVYMEVKDNLLYVARATKSCVWQPLSPVIGQLSEIGMSVYPIASFTVAPRKNSARGRGEVLSMIPNQIEYNSNLVRMTESVKNAAYPKVVYDRDAVDNIDDITTVGGKIAVSGATGAVTEMVGYLPPSGMSADATVINQILCDKTRELHNAGGAATGDIDPTKTSGTAIIAIRDQSAIPLNEMQAEFKKMYEEIALIFYRYLVAHNPSGVTLSGAYEEDGAEIITQKELDDANTKIRIDVSNIQPYSIYAREQALEALLNKGLISFEEYVEALPDNCTAPKAELTELLQKRAQMQQVAQVEQAITGAQNEQAEQDLLVEMAQRGMAQAEEGDTSGQI